MNFHEVVWCCTLFGIVASKNWLDIVQVWMANSAAFAVKRSEDILQGDHGTTDPKSASLRNLALLN